MATNLQLTDFDFALPQQLIAQYPSQQRHHSRLLCVQRQSSTLIDRHVYDLPKLLQAGDLLVVNDSQTMAARLLAHKPTGAKVEILIVQLTKQNQAMAMLKSNRAIAIGSSLRLAHGVEAEVMHQQQSLFTLRFNRPVSDIMHQQGTLPIPPYIQRQAEAIDSERYQTVYAKHPGSVATPTAGLHFTHALLAQLRTAGINLATLTLHVGIGTFLPVRVEQIKQHKMHAEQIHIPSALVQAVRTTKSNGGRVIAVGTTTARSLETFHQAILQDQQQAEHQDIWGESDLFLYPGKSFNLIDALMTNFHLPKSTLFMLVCAFASQPLMQRAYAHAIAQQYRFFSYGDAMLIE